MLSIQSKDDFMRLCLHQTCLIHAQGEASARMRPRPQESFVNLYAGISKGYIIPGYQLAQPKYILY